MLGRAAPAPPHLPSPSRGAPRAGAPAPRRRPLGHGARASEPPRPGAAPGRPGPRRLNRSPRSIGPGRPGPVVPRFRGDPRLTTFKEIRMHRTTSAVLMSALFAGAAAPAFADDLTPAPWRFGAGTTFEHWDFSAGPIGGPPDAPGTNLFNPYGTPIMTPTLGATWLPAASGRTNVWFLGGTSMLTFDVPNTAN